MLKKIHPKKKILLIIVLAGFNLSLTSASDYRVKFVYDGDTILLENGDKVRYLGINSPEVDHEGGKSEFMAEAAWRLNRKTVGNGRVRIELDQETKDRYGRILAYVYLSDGRMVNNMLLGQGMAHVMVKNNGLKYKNLLLETQRKAMKKKVGIWAREQRDKEAVYLGNKNSFRFHRPDCPFGEKIAQKNLTKFKNRNDAFWEGYCPCKHCRP